MTFTYDEADLSTTIRNFKYDGNYFKVQYLDGSSANYFCIRRTEKERLEDLMIEQAVDRQGMMPQRELKHIKNLSFSTAAIATIALTMSNRSNGYALSTLAFAGACFGICNYRQLSSRVNELKKYELFLELRQDMTAQDEQSLLDTIEFDHFYQIPLNINTLDEYSYRDVKRLHKTFYNNFN